MPFYHIVTDTTPIHIKHLYKASSITQFKNDLEFLLENYAPIGLNDLLDGSYLNKEMPCFHLTFDDGLKEFYTNVAPILKEKNIPATVFLNSDFIDNKELFYRFKASILYDQLKDKKLLEFGFNDIDKLNDLANKNGINFSTYLSENSPYLTFSQINELKNEGFTFGAHSKSHPIYKQLTLNEQLIQTVDSVEVICKQFDLDYKVFSFPFTDDGVTNEFFEKISDKVNLTFGCAGIKDDVPNHFQRLSLEGKQKASTIIKEEYLNYLVKKKIGKNRVIRQ